MYARCSVSVAASENCHAMYDAPPHVRRQDKFIIRGIVGKLTTQHD